MRRALHWIDIGVRVRSGLVQRKEVTGYVKEWTPSLKANDDSMDDSRIR